MKKKLFYCKCNHTKQTSFTFCCFKTIRWRNAEWNWFGGIAENMCVCQIDFKCLMVERVHWENDARPSEGERTGETEKEQAELQGCRGVCCPTGCCCRFRNHLWTAFVKCLSLCGSFCACGDLPWEPKRGPTNLRSQGSPWGQWAVRERGYTSWVCALWFPIFPSHCSTKTHAELHPLLL